MIIVAALFQSIATFSQSLEIDLGVDLENPEFLLSILRQLLKQLLLNFGLFPILR